MPWLELELLSSAGHSSDHLCSEMLAFSFYYPFIRWPEMLTLPAFFARHR
jgi:hypothetical protein